MLFFVGVAVKHKGKVEVEIPNCSVFKSMVKTAGVNKWPTRVYPKKTINPAVSSNGRYEEV